MKASSRRLLGQEPEEKSRLQEMEEALCGLCPSMGYRARMLGFGVCLAIGCLLTIGSLTRWAPAVGCGCCPVQTPSTRTG